MQFSTNAIKTVGEIWSGKARVSLVGGPAHGKSAVVSSGANSLQVPAVFELERIAGVPIDVPMFFELHIMGGAVYARTSARNIFVYVGA